MKWLKYLVDDKLYDDFREHYPNAESLAELLRDHADEAQTSEPGSEPSYAELKELAKAAGINPVGKSKDAIKQLLNL